MLRGAATGVDDLAPQASATSHQALFKHEAPAEVADTSIGTLDGSGG